MKNELMTTGNNSVEKITFTADQVALIKRQICPKATDAELQLFLYQAKRSGLDPLTRQIYAIHRKQGQEEKMTIQTSIDGFRVIAERSGVYAGQDKPVYGPSIEFEYNTTEWQNGQRSNIAKKRMVPEFAEVTVYKFHGDQRYAAATGIAYWDEYYPGASMGTMWHKMPHTMLAKCAESVALRKAFPQDLSGLYTVEELPETTEDTTATVVETKPATLPELNAGTKRYDLVVEKLRNRTSNLTEVKKYFTLSNEVEEVLKAIETAAAEEKKSALLPQETLS